MFPVEKIRQQQEQRLQPALESWNDAKKNLESAIALAEAREKEYHAIAEDVQQKLDALQVVIGMAAELENAQAGISAGAKRAELPAPESTNSETQAGLRALSGADAASEAATPLAQGGVVRVTSRKLFAQNWRTPESKSSILQLR